MFFDSKNEKQNNPNNLGESLSKISPNDSNEDKNQISLSECNDIFNYPSPKKLSSEMAQLSKRIRKEEYDNEFSNREKAEILRTKYITANKTFCDENMYNRNYYKFTPNKEKISIRLIGNKNINKINSDKKKLFDKKILKHNLNLKSINKTEKIEYINSKKAFVFDFTSKRDFFSDLLKEECNFMDNIKPINKNNLLSIKNDKDKIIILLDKNKEIMNEIRKIEDNYKKLRNEYIELYKNINCISLNNNQFDNINQEYENYIVKENTNLKKKLSNFNDIFFSLTKYINDISQLFHIKQINFVEIKQNIINSNSEKEIDKININDILNENIKTINKALKEKLKLKNNFKFNPKIFEKIRINK